MKAVRFGQYGGVDVLKVVDAPVPEPGQGEALIKVKADQSRRGQDRRGPSSRALAGDVPLRRRLGLRRDRDQGRLGVASAKVGDEVIGFTDKRASHAEYVVAEARNLTPKPAGIPGRSRDRSPSRAAQPTPQCMPYRSNSAIQLPCRPRRAASARSQSSWPGGRARR